MPPRRLVLTTLGVVLASTVSCSSGGTATSGPGSGSSAGGDDHGEVAGAVELAEPALGLTTVDAAGVVRHLDLLEETTTDLADLADPGPAGGVSTDGRYVFVQGPDGLDVVDSGVWTWDHVDHFHYYRAEPRHLGRVERGGATTVATTGSSTSGGTGIFSAATGEAVLLDTGALADGELVERWRRPTTPHDGLVVPVGDLALLTETDATGAVTGLVGLDEDGEPIPGEQHRCPGASGTTTTRVGAVVGCADGALLATVVDDALQVEQIPYPDGASAPPATSFAGRDGRPTVAGLAGDEGVWLLDTRARAWTLLDPPVRLVSVVAVDDDDEHVVGLSAAGRVVVLDGTTGTVLATSRRLAARSLATGTGVPTLVADQQRVYLSAPAEHRLHEIDHADGARVARTFTTPTPPLHLAGTGR